MNLATSFSPREDWIFEDSQVMCFLSYPPKGGHLQGFRSTLHGYGRSNQQPQSKQLANYGFSFVPAGFASDSGFFSTFAPIFKS